MALPGRIKKRPEKRETWLFRPKERICPGLNFGAFDEFAGASVDFDVFAFFEVKGHGDFGSSFEGSGFGATGGGVAFDAGIGFDDLQDHECRKLDADGFPTMEENLDFDVVLEEADDVRNVGLVDMDLFVVGLIHEHVFVILFIEVFHFADFEIGFAYGVARTEIVFEDASRDEGFVFGFDEGNAFARLDVLTFDNDKRLTVDLDFQILAKVLS